MDDHRMDRVSRALAGPLSRRQALKLLGGGVAGGLAVAGGVNLKTASAQGGLTFPIEFASRFGSFVGEFVVSSFAVQQGQVVAIGTLTGEVFDAAGDLVGPISQALTLPVLGGGSTAVCTILDLELGPLDLTLLGLRVQLSEIDLLITALPGEGLLGDLLCAINDLLAGPGGALGRLRNLLNQLLGLLGGA